MAIQQLENSPDVYFEATAPQASSSKTVESRLSDQAWSRSSEIRSDVLSGPLDKKPIFIKRVDLTINGTSIDQIEDKQTEDECMQSYWRMFTFNGQMNSLVTNGISYSDFRQGYYFCVFDLTTSGKSGARLYTNNSKRQS